MVSGIGCPECRLPLERLRCASCGVEYAVRDGIPWLVCRTRPSAARQATYYDEAVDAEFEITRPHGTPRLYGRLLREKFRRSVRGVELCGRSVLVVCAGSGMDAEFLARSGACVTTVDISHGAATRTLERARRAGFDLVPLVADVERLPFVDASFDVVYVHDGLHHLDRPERGLEEMTRVARHAVCVTEPARAAVTAAAVRLGLAEAVEDAGNVVERLDAGRVVRVLGRSGFRPVRVERYAMLYRHEPGAAMRFLSLAPVYPLVLATFLFANRVLGRVGNKLVVVGVREG
ncbi:MAG TPA: class I SAM-dependent methyltransferase [Gaiellaceae bacterium]|jgi:SAM-dependent methyltransferase|nr:class I SAM-dependent methyltransferase [Gaiellaceae bacterium]